MARLLQAYVRALRDAMFRAIAMCICRGMVTRAGSIDVSIVLGKHKEFRSPRVWPVGLFWLVGNFCFGFLCLIKVGGSSFFVLDSNSFNCY